MADVSFVRNEMLPQQAAPASTVGVIGWMRKNLFSSWLNAVLTIVSIVLVYLVLRDFLGWALHSSWNAQSLDECRRNIAKAYGAGTHGACWAVIHERYKQFIYGFYPPQAYWRVNLAAVLLLAAIAPVLFTALPRVLLRFSIAIPFVIYWLIWGGSLWGPALALLGFVIGAVLFRLLAPRWGVIVGVIAAILGPVIWWLLLVGPLTDQLENVISLALTPIPSRHIGGILLSVVIGVTGIGFSLPIGIFLALGRQTNLPIVRALSVGFIEFIRGVPLITLLFVASTLLNIFLPPGTTFDIVLRVIIMVTLFYGAYMAEVIRGGLAALPRGQYEAAAALGLDYWKSQRLIIMPQALKVSIPGIVSTFIAMFKDTTLVSIIGLMDPMGLTTAIRANSNWDGIVWELYGFVAAVFFVFCFAMSRYSMYLERKLQTGHS